MKKSIFALLGIIIIVCIAFISYSRIYTITDNKRQLEDNITQFNNRPTVIANNIDITDETFKVLLFNFYTQKPLS
jgi:hypothetical protein